MYYTVQIYEKNMLTQSMHGSNVLKYKWDTNIAAVIKYSKGTRSVITFPFLSSYINNLYAYIVYTSVEQLRVLCWEFECYRAKIAKRIGLVKNRRDWIYSCASPLFIPSCVFSLSCCSFELVNIQKYEIQICTELP